jgi:hypothetical protein
VFPYLTRSQTLRNCCEEFAVRKYDKVYYVKYTMI